MSRRNVVFVRFAPWKTFQNAHPHDLMWPVQRVYTRSIAERAGWNASIIDLHVEDPAEDDLVRALATRKPAFVFSTR